MHITRDITYLYYIIQLHVMCSTCMCTTCTADLGIKQMFTYIQLYVCLYDRVALLKGTNQNLSMRSLQIQCDQEIVKVQLLYTPI